MLTACYNVNLRNVSHQGLMWEIYGTWIYKDVYKFVLIILILPSSSVFM